LATYAAEGQTLSAEQFEHIRRTRRLFGTVRRPDGELWTDLAEGLAQKNNHAWDEATDTFERVREKARGSDGTLRLPGVAARANLQLADIARLRGNHDAALKHLDQVQRDAGLSSIWAELVRGLADGLPIEVLRLELEPAFADAGCPLGATVIGVAEERGATGVMVNWT
jgi:hypothetical protein